MGGKRMIHESLFSSNDLADLPVEARYLYIATIIHADDAGRMKADPRYLKLKAFPFDNHPVDKVRTWRNQLTTKCGLLVVYEFEGQEYLYHPKWDKWQTLRKDRLKPTDCPDPDNQKSTICQPTDNQMSTIGKPLPAEVNLTEVNRREVNNTAKAWNFDAVWAKYPRKEGKTDAARHFKAQVKTEKDWNDINRALDNFSAKLRKDATEPKFIPHGSTWFNNRWQDYIDNDPQQSARTSQWRPPPPSATPQTDQGMNDADLKYIHDVKIKSLGSCRKVDCKFCHPKKFEEAQNAPHGIQSNSHDKPVPDGNIKTEGLRKTNLPESTRSLLTRIRDSEMHAEPSKESDGRTSGTNGATLGGVRKNPDGSGPPA